jgi:cell division septum initiation protein DivIVA
MENKKIKKLKRTELLTLLLEVTQENEELKRQIAELTQQLDSREVAIEKSGSIAEAALQLSGVFEAAQKAADIYLYNLQKANDEPEQPSALTD